MLRDWQKYLEGISTEAAIPEEPDSHDHVEDYDIVEPPEAGEDQEQAHGGDDSCQDVPDAPEREEAQGEKGKEAEDESQSPDSPSDPEEGEKGEGEEEAEGEPEGSDSSEEESEEEEDSEEEEEGEGAEEGEKNRQEAFSLNLEAARRRRLATTFSSIIAKVAEDLSGWPVPGDDEWDVQAIMERRITHRPLGQCRQSREKKGVVIILDTSGSCSAQAKFYSRIAELAVKAGDVELYAAPNGRIAAKASRSGVWEPVDDWRWNFAGRTIIFFGDFDGGDCPVEASRENKVYWFSCEDRYTDMDEHNWCRYTLADFRGKYFACRSEDDFLRLAKKVR